MPTAPSTTVPATTTIAFAESTATPSASATATHITLPTAVATALSPSTPTPTTFTAPTTTAHETTTETLTARITSIEIATRTFTTSSSLTEVPTATQTKVLKVTSKPTTTPTQPPIVFQWVGPVTLANNQRVEWSPNVYNNIHQQYGALTIDDDPVLGKVFLSTITTTFNDPNSDAARVYMDKFGPPIKPSENGRCTASVSFIFSDRFDPPRSGFTNFLSIFSQSPTDSPNDTRNNGYGPMASILIDRGLKPPSIYANVDHNSYPPYGQYDFNRPLLPGHRYRLDLGFDLSGILYGDIYEYVYDKNSRRFVAVAYDDTSGPMDPNIPRQLVSVHGPAYQRGIPAGQWIRSSAINIVCR